MPKKSKSKPRKPRRKPAGQPKRLPASQARPAPRHEPQSPPSPRGKSPLKLRVLITAGPTREYLDPVRYLSNDSSGQMGFALAAAAQSRGHNVTLIHGPVALPKPGGVRVVAVTSAADMLTACARAWKRCDLLIMAAAVADYTPAAVASRKLKKSDLNFTLELTPTVDVLAELAATRRADQRVIGFALEDRSPRARAEEKLHRKRLDAIVLNRPAAIGKASSAIEVLTRDGPWRNLTGRKTTHARKLITMAERLF